MMGRLWMSLMVGKSKGDALEANSRLNVVRSTLRSSRRRHARKTGLYMMYIAVVRDYRPAGRCGMSVYVSNK